MTAETTGSDEALSRLFAIRSRMTFSSASLTESVRGRIRERPSRTVRIPSIVRTIDHRIPVFVDCGVESGADVFKALALGADAVCVGRHLMPCLKKDDGAVAARITEITQELMSLMARTGSSTLAEIDPGVLHFRTF